MQNNAIEAGAAAMLSVALSLRTIERLIANGVLTEADGKAITTQSLAALDNPAQAKVGLAMMKAVAASSRFTVTVP